MGYKKIMLTADDYGYTDYVDDAIIDCIKAGSIDCVDLFVTHSGINARVNKLLAAREELYQTKGKKISIGLHFTLTSGKPLYTGDNDYVKEVCDNDDNFKGRYRLQSRMNKLSKAKYSSALKGELEAQYQKFKTLLNQEPDHLSCHSGVMHFTKSLLQIYVPFAHKKRIPVRRPALIEEQMEGIDTPAYPTWQHRIEGMLIPSVVEFKKSAEYQKFNRSHKNGGLRNDFHDLLHFDFQSALAVLGLDLAASGIEIPPIKTTNFCTGLMWRNCTISDYENSTLNSILSKIYNRTFTSNENESYEIILHLAKWEGDKYDDFKNLLDKHPELPLKKRKVYWEVAKSCRNEYKLLMGDNIKKLVFDLSDLNIKRMRFTHEDNL